MTQRDERLYFAEILEREAFFSDPRTQDAVIRNIEIIGEGVRGVSQATRRAHCATESPLSSRGPEPSAEGPPVDRLTRPTSPHGRRARRISGTS
jgi:hypothetical protein